MYDPLVLLLIVITFLIAGTVKGVIGLGLPTVSLGLITAVLDVPTAMVLLLVPSFVTNIWQAMAGGHGWVVLTRIWPFLLMSTVTVWVGAIALTYLALSFLSALLGVLLVTYSLINLAGVSLTVSPRQEAWVGPVLGTANGIITGMTGSCVVPGVMFLQAIGLPRDMLIQSMGMLFASSTLALAVALQSNNLLTVELGTLSAFALLPAIAGMMFGQRIRRQLSEQLFRKTFFIAILLLGSYIIARAFYGAV